MNPPAIRMMKLGDLQIDPTVQRRLDRGRVEAIVKKFTPNALGVLTANRRANGNYFCVDGQHRKVAGEQVGHTDEVQVNVYDGLSLAEEAALFRLLNNTKRVGAVDLFMVRLVEGDPNALGMRKVLEENGWEIAPANGKGKFSAISTLEKVWEMDPDAARKAINIPTQAWGTVAEAVDGRMLYGFGRFFFRNRAEVDLVSLVEKLAKFQGGAAGLLGQARGLKGVQGGSIADAVATIVTNQYNTYRRSSALPAWK